MLMSSCLAGGAGGRVPGGRFSANMPTRTDRGRGGRCVMDTGENKMSKLIDLMKKLGGDAELATEYD